MPTTRQDEPHLKAARRDKKKRRRMVVSGKSVFALKRLLRQTRGKRTSVRRTGRNRR